MQCIIIPPLHGLQLFNLLRVSLKADTQVGNRIMGHKHVKDTSILLGIGAGDVADLEVHLKRRTSFITSKFDPNFIGR